MQFIGQLGLKLILIGKNVVIINAIPVKVYKTSFSLYVLSFRSVMSINLPFCMVPF